MSIEFRVVCTQYSKLETQNFPSLSGHEIGVVFLQQFPEEVFELLQVFARHRRDENSRDAFGQGRAQHFFEVGINQVALRHGQQARLVEQVGVELG